MDYLINLAGLAGICIILAQSLHLINGVNGQFSLGHAGFWGIGAYAGALVSAHFELTQFAFINLAITCLVAFIVTFFISFIISYPCSKLRGDYLAITTLGFGEIVRSVIQNLEITGGSRGLTNIPKLATTTDVWIYVVFLVFLLNNVLRGSVGRTLVCIREDDIAAENIGFKVSRYKMLAFSSGCAIAGVAGSLFAHFQQFIHPNNFTFLWSVIIFLMLILGGIGSSLGSILGAVILTLLPEILRFTGDLSEYRMIVFSLLLVLLIIFKPQGIFFSKKASLFN